MKDNKVLSISIPTWNRVKLLNELLILLIEQIENYKLENDIEIIVSDNNSTDNTSILLHELCIRYKFIKYFKNSSNLGAKINVIKSLYLANSKFALLLGDDDRIRKDCLHEIVSFLKNKPNTSILLDTSKAKNKLSTLSKIPLDTLLNNYYWYFGNAGLFVCSTKYLKINIDKLGYNFLNECWPQSQLMILGQLIDQGEVFIQEMNITEISKHDEVMLYNSNYLWRTCVLELYNAAFDLRDLIPQSTYDSCRNFMKSNIKQVFLNILQCGLFVDNYIERNTTRRHIYQNIYRFSAIERLYLKVIVAAFFLPTFISRPIANLFILFYKGIAGLEKKNNFVKLELLKRSAVKNNNLVLRKLDFEK